MFRQTLNATPLTTPTADSFFQNIRGGRYGDDTTFISTIRALVAPRIKDGDVINLCFRSSTYTARDVANNPTRVVCNAIFDPGYSDEGDVIIHSFESSQEANYACMELMKSSFCEVNPEWVRIEKVTDFYRKSFYTMCFVNPGKRQAIVFVDNLDVRRMHYLQCAILAIMPWYFNPEEGVSADEMALIQSLREKTPDKYVECIKKIASQYDFRTMFIKNALKGFELKFEKAEVERIKNSISSVLEDIESYEEILASRLSRKRDLDIKLLGLETKISQGEDEDSEIMDYFLCNDKLTLVSVTERELTFVASDYLMYFDEEMARRVIDNKRSYVYSPDGRNMDSIISRDDMQRLMYAIFIEQTLKMKMCAAYTFTIGERVHALVEYGYGMDFSDCMPNPHTDRYRCMGDYERAINGRIKDNDYVGALEQSIASCKSLNFGDSIVMCEFMRRLYGTEGYRFNKCIELPTGETVKPKEAIEWLKNEEAKAATVESVEESQEEVKAEVVLDEVVELVEEVEE